MLFKVKKLVELLDGKKTYLVAVLVAVVNALVAFGVISPEVQLEINAVLAALGLGALRSGVKKAQK